MRRDKDIESLKASSGGAFREIQRLQREIDRLKGGPWDVDTLQHDVRAVRQLASDNRDRLERLAGPAPPQRPRRLLVFLDDTINIDGTAYRVRNIGKDCFEVVEK
jgi:hypothetical protein